MAEEQAQQQPSSAKSYWLINFALGGGFVVIVGALAFNGVKPFDSAAAYTSVGVAVLWSAWAFAHWLSASSELLSPEQHAQLDNQAMDRWFPRCLQALFYTVCRCGLL